MIEQKGTGALHGVKLASFILLLYSLHWLLAACSAAQSVVMLLPATNVEPTSQPTTPSGNLTVTPAQTLGMIDPDGYGIKPPTLEHIVRSKPQYVSSQTLQRVNGDLARV